MIVLQLLDILEEMELELNYLQSNETLEIGKGRVIKEGKKIALTKFWNTIRGVQKCFRSTIKKRN